MSHIRRSLVIILASCLCWFSCITVVHADTANFIVTNFSADYYLSQSDPQGALAINEHLDVTFNDYNHGILRALPQKYNGQPQHLKVIKVLRDGASEPYSTYTSNGNEVLKIGSAAKTITGVHSYDIDYNVQNVIRFTGGHDELDWNTNGTEWTQPFENITARLHLPPVIAGRNQGFRCFTGVQGSRSQDCSVNAAGTLATFTTNAPLDSSETMTFATSFPQGTFQKPTAKDWLQDNLNILLEVGLPILLAFAVAYPYWRKNGKDIKGRGTIIPEYAPPADLRPAEADVINTYKLGKNAVSATIIDLAIRKYVKIIEGTSDGVLGIGKHKTYTFQRLPEPAGDSLKPYERQIYDGLFPNGDVTSINDLKKEFYPVLAAVKSAVPTQLTASGYFAKNPRTTGNRLHVIGFIMIAVGWFLHSWLTLGVIAGGLIFLLFATLMPRRTQRGVDAKDVLSGLKLYMNTAEKDRLAMLQSANAPYAAQSAEPQKTVALFEKLLPYAMIMGVEQSWAQQFKDIYSQPPNWYAGNWTSFNAACLVGSLNQSVSAMNSSFAAPASSGAGGGGGFSGGGGGGGGGGGW